MTDTVEATPEYIALLRDKYVPPKVDQGTNRRAARRRTGLEMVAPYLPRADVAALAWFSQQLHGAERPPNITASYGDQRWNGTPVSQQVDGASAYRDTGWRDYCRDHVIAAERSINATPLFVSIQKVLLEDWSLEEVGTLFCESRAVRTLRRHGSEQFRRASDRLLAYYRTTPDYKQTHPGGF